MHLAELVVSGFRNLQETTITPGTGLNIVWGDNAQGKTNLLEAIYLLGHSKSFRVARAEDLIAHDRDLARVEGEMVAQRVRHSIRWSASARERIYRLDNMAPRSLADVAQVLPQVLFAPEEILAVKGSPAQRRALLDRALFQLEPESIRLLQAYRRNLLQRNLLLRENAAAETLAPWTTIVARSGSEVRRARQRLVKELEPTLQQIVGSLTQQSEIPEIRCMSERDAAGGEELLLESLQRLEKQERRLGMTLAGPHRDDPVFCLGGTELRRYGSQGQQRTFMLAFKAALVKCLHRLRGVTPMLLLDDITSELDASRRGALFELLREDLGQVFVTTTDPGLLEGTGFGDPRLFHVGNGTITAA